MTSSPKPMLDFAFCFWCVCKMWDNLVKPPYLKLNNMQLKFNDFLSHITTEIMFAVDFPRVWFFRPGLYTDKRPPHTNVLLLPELVWNPFSQFLIFMTRCWYRMCHHYVVILDLCLFILMKYPCIEQLFDFRAIGVTWGVKWTDKDFGTWKKIGYKIRILFHIYSWFMTGHTNQWLSIDWWCDMYVLSWE